MSGDDDSNKVVQPVARRKPPAAGMGRRKGVPNKMTRQLKEMILEALDNAGGVEYLAAQAEENPTAFLTLVGKVLPLQLQGDKDNPIAFADVTEDAQRVASMINDLARRSAEGVTLQ